MTDQFLKLSEIQKSYNLTRHTLASFEEQGILHPIRTSGGQRRYLKSELDNLAKSIPSTSSFIVPTTDDFEKPSPKSRDTYGELGTTGLAHFGGSVAEERLRELRGTAGRERYREMATNDPVIAAVLFAIGHALKQPEHRVQPASDKEADKVAAEFIEECLDDMSFTWLDTKTFIIAPMLEQGLSLLEIVYKKRLGPNPPGYDKEKNPASSKFDDGRIGWRKWSPRPVESLVPGSEWVFDAHGGVSGINQMDYYGTGKTFSIPIAKLLHFRSSVHPANTPEPPPVTRPAYVPYIYTKNFQEIEGIGIERDLQGLPVMYLGKDAQSLYDTAKTVVTNVRVDEQMGLVIPYPKMGAGAAEGQGVLFELVSSNNARAHDIGAVIDRYDKRKALVTLTQFIFLGMQEVGSYALSRTQGDLFMLAASAWLKGIADIINRHAIPRLMALNSFPGISGMPELVFNPMGVPNLAEVADYVNKLVDKEVITPDFEMEKTLRKLAELPDPDESVEDRWKKKVEMALNPPTPPPAMPPGQQPNGVQPPQPNQKPPRGNSEPPKVP